MILVSYINAANEEIILDDMPRTFIGELYGRQGFEAPTLKYSKAEYGSGATDILTIEMEPREITLFFWAPMGTPYFETKLERVKSRLIQTGNKKNDWGRLVIRALDGTYREIKCAYTGGLDDAVRESWSWIKFTLTFTASDPLFYDEYPTVKTISLYKTGGLLHFPFHFGRNTFFRDMGWRQEETIRLDGYRVFPEITFTGPASAIQLENLTTGQSIEFEDDFTLLRGESLTIKTAKEERGAWWTKYDGTVVKALRYLKANSSLDWMMVNGGNRLRIRNAMANVDSVCRLSYQQGYLTVN